MNITVGGVAEECGGVGAERKVSLPFDEAVAAAVAAARPSTSRERVDLDMTAGRVLAADVASAVALPRFDHSAMDGYAVRISDFSENGPRPFKVVGKALAGDAPRATVHGHGTAMEIYTGAPIPEGFDTVLIRERCTRIGSDGILASFLPRAGENIRRRGEDVAMGDLVASSGSLVTSHVVAMFAALGMSEIDVRPKVRVALLATGSELRSPGEPLGPGQIYDSNRYMAAAMLSLPWIKFTDLGRVSDDPVAIAHAIRTASQDCDVLLTSGGMSHGAADHVRAALAANHASLEVLNVAMRPGKPATIGRVGRALIIGLPGNPMAAAVVLHQIALPAIRRTAGLARHESELFPAIAGFDYTKREGRTEFVPVKVVGRDVTGLPVLSALGRGSSGSLLPMAQADGLAVLSEDVVELERGSPLRYVPFRWQYD